MTALLLVLLATAAVAAPKPATWAVFDTLSPAMRLPLPSQHKTGHQWVYGDSVDTIDVIAPWEKEEGNTWYGSNYVTMLGPFRTAICRHCLLRIRQRLHKYEPKNAAYDSLDAIIHGIYTRTWEADP